MHIADGFINQPACVVTSGLAAASLVWAVKNARKTATPDSIKMLPLVTLTVFAGQMLNFAVDGSISGHLLGSALAAILLGPALAMIAMATILTAQCLFLGDGGLMALGANFLSMGVVGVFAADFVWNKLRENTSPWVAAGVSSWSAVMAASIACTAALVFSGLGSAQIATQILANHGLIGMAESAMTIGAVLAVGAAGKSRRKIAVISCLAVLFFAFVPFASSLPDGLEAALANSSQTGTVILGLVMSTFTIVACLRVYVKSMRKPVALRIRR